MKSPEYFDKMNKEIPYPNRDHIKQDLVENVKRTFVGTYNQIQVAIKQAEEDSKTEYNRQSDEQRERVKAVNLEFKEWLFEMYGNTDNKVNEVVYDEAWDEGHAYGFQEVANKFQNIMNFAERIIVASRQ